MSELTRKAFWLVWNPQRTAPTYRHQSSLEATAEAERLARTNPGETFVVLESVCARCVDYMAKIDMSPDCDIPF